MNSTEKELETVEINVISRFEANEKGLAKWCICQIIPEKKLAFDQELRIILPKATATIFSQRMRTELSRLRAMVRDKLDKPAQLWRLETSIERRFDKDILIVVKTKNKATITQEVEKALESLAV